MVWYSNQNSF